MVVVNLYYNNSKEFETNNEGVRVSGILEMLDNKPQLGDGEIFKFIMMEAITTLKVHRINLFILELIM